jgi:hypothetical protein
MRNHYLAAVAAVTLTTSIGMTPATAQARDYPFCIKGDFWAGSVGDCTFQTYQQCLAMASGRGGIFCDANPFFDHRSSQAAVVDSNKRSRRSH